MSANRLYRGFTLIELIVVTAIIGMLFSVVIVILSGAQKDAKDKRRIADMQQLQRALELFYTDHQYYPREGADQANGNTQTNGNFKNLVEPYINASPRDPVNNSTFYYYYDGRHRCGNRYFAVIFARQMENPDNANYTKTLNETCLGTLDGEGRGSPATGSYNIILGESGG